MNYSVLLLALVATMGQTWDAVAAMTFSVTTRLGGIGYYMDERAESGLEVNTTSDIEPATVFCVETSHDFNADYLTAEVKRFRRTDDVWSIEFLANIVIVYRSEGALTSPTIDEVPKEWRTDRINYLARMGLGNCHEGPFFFYAGRLHAAYRLYPDTAGAFVVGTVPADAPFTYKAVDAAAYGEQHPSALSIPVPFRLYFRKSSTQPYAGTRIAIKDIVDLAGLKTGASSRVYTQLHPPRIATAQAVQKLLELGFVVVGKTKTTQFADSEWPMCDWVDYHAPFNPVGDRYQTTSGSSAGSAAAVAAYGWLDFALGTDTLGSIRAPAAAQGIYGMRSSLGAASFYGVIPYSPHFDTIGAFSRDAKSLARITRALYGSRDTPKCLQKPSKLLYPTDYWPGTNAETQKVYEAYIAKVEKYSGIERSEINLAKIWQDTNFVKTNKSLEDYFEHAFEWVANPDRWSGFFKAFDEEYEVASGHQPILNPQLRFKRDYLRESFPSNYEEEALELLRIFREWFETNIIPPAKDGCSDAIMVLPWSSGEPDYRDRYRESEPKFTGVAFFFYNIAPYAQSPEMILPAGNVSFKSKVTLRTEQLPVGLGVVSARVTSSWQIS